MHRFIPVCLIILAAACSKDQDSNRRGDTTGPAGDTTGPAGDTIGQGDSGGDSDTNCVTVFEFEQAADGDTADILFVIDNSGSMGQEQTAIGESATQLLTALAGVDFHIGVITTDATEGGVLRSGGGTAVVTSSTPDAATVLAANLDVGISGASQEKPLETTALALGRGSSWDPMDPPPESLPNAGFLRTGYCLDTCEGTTTSCVAHPDCQDSPLIIVFVSDEDDESFGPVRYYWRLFESVRGPGNEGRIRIVAIAGPVPDGCRNEARGTATAAPRLAELTTLDGGSFYDICDDLNEAMTAIGSLAVHARHRFPLDGFPSLNAALACGTLTPGPFCVRVNDEPVDGYTYDSTNNEIVFDADAIPPAGSSITVAAQVCAQSCMTNDTCGTGRFCNVFGWCQSRAACGDNADCESDQICNGADPSGGACIPDPQCGSSVQCDLNNYCTAGTLRCEPGCRSTGDCQLGYVCAAGDCLPGGTAADCTICPADPTTDSDYCDYGEICTTLGECVQHVDQAGLCHKPCSTGADCANSLVCMPDDLGGAYCAPSCDTEADCPSGYRNCAGFSIFAGPCGGTPGPCECTSTWTCPNGGRCIGTPGTRGYCECLNDDECDLLSGICFMDNCMNGAGSCDDDDCACVNNRCAIGDHPCNTAADCRVSCVQYPLGDGTTYGLCTTDSKVCGKIRGLSCDELTTGTAPCRGL